MLGEVSQVTPMKSHTVSAIILGVLFAAGSAGAADQNAADLETYSVGERRPDVIEKPTITIERPKLDFTLERPRPNFDSARIAKPKLEILSSPEDETSTGALASARGSTSSVGGSGESRSVQPLNMEAPTYPREALRRREEGFVVVEFTVNALGRTEDIQVVEAEPRGTFDREAMRAVSRWEFEPALRDGRAVPQRIRHTIEFKLD